VYSQHIEDAMYPFTYPHTIDNGAGERLTLPPRFGEKGDDLVQNGSLRAYHHHPSTTG
jgi:hypothetical protein